MKKGVTYHVFNWEYKCGENWFDDLKLAEKHYQKWLKEEPYLSWRLYEVIEEPYGSGNFEENCLDSNMGVHGVKIGEIE